MPKRECGIRVKTFFLRAFVIGLAAAVIGFIFIALEVGPLTAGAVDSGSHLTFMADDGLTLHAWKTEGRLPDAAAGQKPGLALLLPMLRKTHDSFEPFREKLNEIGYTTIAFDLRGHGQSTKVGPTTISATTMNEAEFAKIPSDVERFFLDFKSRHGDKYDYDNVVIVGASIGANSAALLLGRDWVQRVALLSPGRDYRSLTPENVMADTAHILSKPVYMAVSIDDTYSAQSCQWLFDHYLGPKVFKRYPGQNHGTDMLRKVKDADHELLDWLKQKF